MRLKFIVSLLGMVLVLAGCTSVQQPRARVDEGLIENPSLGFFGFHFEFPPELELYNPLNRNPVEYTALQQMAVRIYEKNRAYHPRGNERFYESFLLLGDNTAFLLITVKQDALTLLDDSPFSDDATTQWQLMPLYNPTGTRPAELGESRRAAIWTRGYAYEHKGWYYAATKRNRMLFNYEACKADGSNSDSYILMGFALPEDASRLTSLMQQMLNGINF